jgi:hypothetical protein
VSDRSGLGSWLTISERADHSYRIGDDLLQVVTSRRHQDPRPDQIPGTFDRERHPPQALSSILSTRACQARIDQPHPPVRMHARLSSREAGRVHHGAALHQHDCAGRAVQGRSDRDSIEFARKTARELTEGIRYLHKEMSLIYAGQSKRNLTSCTVRSGPLALN